MEKVYVRDYFKRVRYLVRRVVKIYLGETFRVYRNDVRDVGKIEYLGETRCREKDRNVSLERNTEAGTRDTTANASRTLQSIAHNDAPCSPIHFNNGFSYAGRHE